MIKEIAARRRFSLSQGDELLFLKGLKAGAHGVVGGGGDAVSGWCRELIDFLVLHPGHGNRSRAGPARPARRTDLPAQRKSVGLLDRGGARLPRTFRAIHGSPADLLAGSTAMIASRYSPSVAAMKAYLGLDFGTSPPAPSSAPMARNSALPLRISPQRDHRMPPGIAPRRLHLLRISNIPWTGWSPPPLQRLAAVENQDRRRSGPGWSSHRLHKLHDLLRTSTRPPLCLDEDSEAAHGMAEAVEHHKTIE